MKRKLQKLTTEQLRMFFDQEFSTTHLSNEILNLLRNSSDTKQIMPTNTGIS